MRIGIGRTAGPGSRRRWPARMTRTLVGEAVRQIDDAVVEELCLVDGDDFGRIGGGDARSPRRRSTGSASTSRRRGRNREETAYVHLMDLKTCTCLRAMTRAARDDSTLPICAEHHARNDFDPSWAVLAEHGPSRTPERAGDNVPKQGGVVEKVQQSCGFRGISHSFFSIHAGFRAPPPGDRSDKAELTSALAMRTRCRRPMPQRTVKHSSTTRHHRTELKKAPRCRSPASEFEARKRAARMVQSEDGARHSDQGVDRSGISRRETVEQAVNTRSS